MPNVVAYLVLLSWPVVVVVLFRTLRLPTALIWSFLGAFLFLPVLPQIDLPILPPIDKTLVASVPALLMTLIVSRAEARRRAAMRGRTEDAPPEDSAPADPLERRLLWAMLALVLLAPVLTMLANRAPVILADQVLPGLGPRDVLVETAARLFALLPFLLARRHLATAEAHAQILRALCFGALAYSVLILIEVRLSPQLNVWIYGFFPHSFLQHMRAGGFRALVFLPHGLWVGIFMACAVLGTIALARSGGRAGAPYAVAAIWLAIALVLSKNLGATLILLALGPLVLLLGVRGQLWAAAAIAAIVLSYPAARGAGLVPVAQIEAAAAAISADRAQSLSFRLGMEEMLLERANEKPLAGWGGWGRNRIYDERGRDLSVTDGRWIITVGRGGWPGYLGEFGLLTVPILLLAWRRRRLALTLPTAGLALVMAANLVDLIPNAALSPVTWLMAGALMGRAARVPVAQDQGAAPPAPAGPQAPRYSRFGPAAVGPARSRAAAPPQARPAADDRARPSRARG